MKFARFRVGNESQWKFGILEEEGKLRVVEGSILGQWLPTDDVYPLEHVKLGAPLIPNQIIGIGLNYVAQGEAKPEAGQQMPTFFFKPPSTVVGPNEQLIIPDDLTEIKFEAEIAVVIGKSAYRVTAEQALDYVFGYTIANDVTATSYFHPNGNWTLSKVFPTFTPLGPYIETELDLTRTVIRSELNGELKQCSGTERMIESIPDIIAYLTKLMPLHPGDVILSGAPAGADLFRRGDTIKCSVEGIGELVNQAALGTDDRLS
ncbi:fumarylacetoacetate hydrolase family protein [Paenibacillus sp. YYML68]|uniref:fumarylacetoacetate hydrolase family protein n=1 Tax=Paenibacillus sp. YYML68 TaxID=2909250 RepID=UPI0024912745|nr:fumarylacetoacetate hydrolase family protein [Paenibacillus sp. YYML68]